MRPGPSLIAKYISENLALDASPRDISLITRDIILDKGLAQTATIAEELAAKWGNRILDKLRIDLTTYLETGRPTRYTFNSSSDYFIQGICFVEPSDSLQTAESKNRRLLASNYLSTFSDLTPDDFELLCGKLIGLLGVDNPVVTRHSADEGIDFYGKLSLGSLFYPEDLTPTIQKQLNIWLVGQAKHYQQIQTGTSEIRELVGSVMLGRAHTFGSVNSPLSQLDIKVADPVFCVFITTGQLSKNAWLLLKRSGVIGMDGEMVAAFLADRTAGIVNGNFEHDKFLEWVRNNWKI